MAFKFLGRLFGRVFRGAGTGERFGRIIGQAQSAKQGPLPAARPLPTIPRAEELSHNEQVIASGAEVALASSWQEKLRWDWRSKTTDWWTKNGSHYRYGNMDIEVVVKWVESSSPGRWWWSNIAGVYSPATVVYRAPRGTRRTRPNVVRIVNRRRRR